MNKTRFILSMTMLLIFSFGLALAQPQGGQQPTAEQAASPAAPELADIVPLAARLTGRLAELKKTIQTGLDAAAVEQ